MAVERYRRILGKKMDRELYDHCLRVAETAVGLAERFGADSRKAHLAGLLHDYGKALNADQLREKAVFFGLGHDRIAMAETRLLHAPVGAILIKTELGLDDSDILDAVASHTTGRSGMSLLEKVVYLSDYIEPGRDFDGVAAIRKLAAQDLDQALLAAVDSAISSVLKRKLLLHPLSVEFRNSLLVRQINRSSCWRDECRGSAEL